MSNITEYLQPPLEISPSAKLEIFNKYMEDNVPGWEATATGLDNRMGGAVSQIASQTTEAASDGATNIFRYFGANLANIPPKEAISATGSAVWKMTDSLGHTVPQGTVAIWTNGAGERVQFETTTTTVIAPASTEATIGMIASEPSVNGNGISGAATELVQQLSFVGEVKFLTATTGGAEAETDFAYLTRLKEELTVYSPKLILPKDFTNFCLKQTKVGRCTTLRGFNPTGAVKEKVKISTNKNVTEMAETTTAKILPGTAVSGTGVSGGTFVIEVEATKVVLNQATTKTEVSELTFTGILQQPGYVTSYVGETNGTALGSPEMAEIEAKVMKEESTLTGVEFKVAAPTHTKIKIKVVAYAYPTASTAQVKEAVEGALTFYFAGENWGTQPTQQSKEWGNEATVRILNVEGIILRTVGMHYIKEVQLNSTTANVIMSGIVPLPTLEIESVEIKSG